MKFAGFIITYNRPHLLKDTIEQVFAQTLPPEKLWIIDNSEGNETEEMIKLLLKFPLQYVRMGYNAGPAGAAKKGLELVGKAGYDWIYWGDDNDPPNGKTYFQSLLNIANRNNSCGVVGTVGHYFDRDKGVLKRIETKTLELSQSIEVDYVAGGMCMIVNGDVARSGISPNPKLFFGFEELDFCLKVKRSGFKILIDCKLNIEARINSNRLDFIQPKYRKKKNLKREYYSLRNLLIIGKTLNLKYMNGQIFLRWFIKSIYGFRYGLDYGIKNFKVIHLAFYHFFTNKYGKQIEF
ncbi:glycosyltransferase family 2 protein [Algoriphagus algorifonticola]|uniref:glycosyltransferase family 2 protein n=1 Tax=Algoriphagus algorifonticola TaxID=2593007 RepID=UPI0011AABEDC|nr:glycosyltransferase [Algoriphagus algorifonticola]